MGMHPDKETCMNMLATAGTPEHIIRHCQAVARTAYCIGWEINRARRESTGIGCRSNAPGAAAGRIIDLELLVSAGLLHDMMRLYDNHAGICADILDGIGYREEANIIRTHMKYEKFNDLIIANETDLVVLADSLVIEERMVGLDARADYIVEKAKKLGREDRIDAILAKRDSARRLLAQIEQLTGKTIEQIVADGGGRSDGRRQSLAD